MNQPKVELLEFAPVVTAGKNLWLAKIVVLKVSVNQSNKPVLRKIKLDDAIPLKCLKCIMFSQELEEVRKQLIKAKMTSVTHDKPHSPTGKEQYIQQLHQNLIMVKDKQEIGFFMN